MTREDPIRDPISDAQSILDATGQAREMLDAVAQAREEHLSYEQLEAWVEDAMDQTARELVVAHIGVCPFCAKQLASYESYAPVMSASTAAPAQLVSFWERLRAGFGSLPAAPKFAMLGLAIAVAVLAPTVIRNARSSGAGWEQIEALPPSVRQAAREVVNANSPIRPAALAELAPNADAVVEYAVSEVIEETQLTLRWKSFAESYSVAVMDASNRVVTQTAAIDKAGGTTNVTWMAPVTLNRGAIYTWEVRDSHNNGAVHRASFRILGASEEQTLADLRASGAGPLAMGAVEQQFGMLTAAQREFETLAKETPRSQEATKLLEHVRLLRAQ
jgi:hypothetical protein